MKFTSIITTSAMVVVLTACGGGGGGTKSSESAASYSTLYGGQTYTSIPVSNATAATAFDDTAATGASFVAFASTCNGSTPQSVVRTTNVDVYSDGSISDNATLTKIAQMTEASVIKLRSLFQIAGTVGFDNTNKVRVCASTTSANNGSAGYTTLQLGLPSDDWILARLIHHELVHMVEAQALQCRNVGYRFERWLVEGLALRIGMQDQPSKSEVASLQSASVAAGYATPHYELDVGSMPTISRFPGFRLAIDTFLGEKGKTENDVMNFLRDYGASEGCPTAGNLATGWKTRFDATFSTDLRGTGTMGSASFWTAAASYAY